jgi:4-amino-4-deoxy-L-arabinose transferase-like glycosyltransferase
VTGSLLRRPWAPLLLAMVWLVATAWARPLAIPDEGRYVGVAWNMLGSGDWLVPRLDGLPYFHKPPLFYWITAASLGLFGPSQWAARMAPLLGAIAAMVSLYLFMRRWQGDAEARASLLALATQPLFFIGGQFANLDMLVAGCITAAVLAFAHAALSEEAGNRSRGALAAGYAFVALGLLAKGLIGIVLPALVIGSWLLLRRQWRVLGRLLWAPGIVLFLAIGAPWFVAMQQHFPGFAHYFFVVQHFARYAQGGFNNQQPFWFLAVVLAVLALPWSAWLLSRHARRADAVRARPLVQLGWLWLGLVLLFFSLPSSKLIGYILPATPPLALLVAQAFAAQAASVRARRWWSVGAVTAVSACVIGVTVAAALPRQSARDLGQALRPLVAPGERLVFLHAYYFDLPFYARWQGPVEVVEDWNDPALTSRDNWRKELADAGVFDPARAQRLLRLRSELPTASCDVAPWWAVGPRRMEERYPVLQSARVVAVQQDIVLWRVPGFTAPDCGGRPTSNPAERS